MSDYDYGNARLRAMMSRFLNRRDLDALVESNTLPGLISALTHTAYRKPVETALARVSGMECIAEALRLDMVSTLGILSTFYSGTAREMVRIVLRSYDLHNLKTILRGLEKNVSPGEISQALLPVGDLTPAILSELMRALGPRGVIDALVSLNLPFASPLVQLRAQKPGASVVDMELALDRWHFREAEDFLQRNFRTDETLFAALRLDADIANLLTVLRFAHAASELRLREVRRAPRDTSEFFVEPGRIPLMLLTRAASRETVEGAVNVLLETPYVEPLRRGLQAYAQSRRLSEFEKHLNRYRLDWLKSLIAKDPLGIGVVLGYLALKMNEVRNVRWIAQGINLGLKADAIRQELELVA